MWLSAICSESLRGHRRRRNLPRLLAGGVLCLAAVAPLSAVVVQSQDDALAEAFPGAVVESRTAFLDDAQATRIEALAGSALTARVVTYYTASKEERLIGTAYFDKHRVRTLDEVLMVAVSPQGAVLRVTILTFQEPKDYLPGDRWLAQFDDRKLDSELSLKQGIRGITGATLSGRAVTAAVRRVLALHQVLAEASESTAEDTLKKTSKEEGR